MYKDRAILQMHPTRCNAKYYQCEAKPLMEYTFGNYRQH